MVKFSEGLLSTAVDLALYSVFFTLEFGFAGYGKGARAGEKAIDNLEDFNYKAIKRAFVYLRQKGFIESVKGEMTLPKITANGRKRLESIIPKYDEKRTWDGRIYLVTYDLPIERNKERDYLREFLRRIGCGMLQRSVWLTPYNPSELIEEFIRERNLGKNLILVSSLRKGGTMGEWSLEELVESVYHIQELNERYEDFLFEVKRSVLSKTQLIFSFLSILRDDPQLPFRLLPKDWKGEKAYRDFQKITLKK